MLLVETLTPVGGAGLLPQAKPKAATASPNAKDRYRICLFLPERNAAPGGEQEEYQRKLLARIRVVWTETYGGGKRVTGMRRDRERGGEAPGTCPPRHVPERSVRAFSTCT